MYYIHDFLKHCNMIFYFS